MPQRPLMLGLLWLATAMLLALVVLLLTLRGDGGLAIDAALALTTLLVPLPALCLVALRRSNATAHAHKVAADAKSRFLAQISHEVRTPLNTIMGTTQLALQASLGAEQRDLLGKTDAASRALLGLLDNVLDLSRIEAGRLGIECQPLRLEDVVAQAIELVRPLHGNPAVTLVCDWGKGALLGRLGQLRGDAPRLQQVLVNLLSNSLKFTLSGHATLRLNAGAPDPQGRVPLLLTVHDSGIGMTAEQIAAMYREFHEGDASVPRLDGGSGLGLTLTRRLVELMGGTLNVHSEPGRGSRFDVSLALPLDPTATQPEALPPRRMLLAAPEGASSRTTQALLNHLGLGAGMVVCTGTSATLMALDESRQTSAGFDWLLLDWQLPGPGPTAAELLAQLRRDHPAVRVAVLTPPGLDDPASARAFGARALCAQPLLPGEVRRLLADAPEEIPAASDGLSLSGLRVLVVDDHPVNQEIALRLLGNRGARVELAGHGQEALDKLQAAGPDAFDLVLMDLQMPVLDGLSATRRLRELPGFAGVPVLAMTAHALAEERAECLAAGMQGHISKPLDVARLMRELQRYRPPPAQAPAPPVLDVTRGLRQFDGRAALYRRTLQGFANQYRAGIDDWHAWIAGGEWAELRRAAHTLQGLGATLGAQGLHHAALALERSAGAADAAAAQHQLGDVVASLNTLLEEIALVLGEPDTAPPPQGSGELAELRQLLAQSDSRALDWWQAHGNRAGLDTPTYKRVDHAIAAMDFDAALLALEGAGR